MQINFEEITSWQRGKADNLLAREVLASTAHDADRSKFNALLATANAEGRKDFDIKILVDGVEFEPNLLDRLLKERSELIDREAKRLVAEKIGDLTAKFNESLDEFRHKFGLRDE